jgi:hypothetical protein
MPTEKPWVSGPKELLEHAAEHMAAGSSFDYRIALISIDNAVELSIKTYLGLPARARGRPGPSRKEMAAGGFGFGDLMDLLEKHFSDRLNGIELGDIEWYHRLRNALYHDGNGVTVDPAKVDAYLQVARILLTNLFDTDLSEKGPAAPHSKLGTFVLHWANLESNVRSLAEMHLDRPNAMYEPLKRIVDELVSKDVLTPSFRSRLDPVYQFRNQVMHGHSTPSGGDLSSFLSEVEELSIAVAGAL